MKYSPTRRKLLAASLLSVAAVSGRGSVFAAESKAQRTARLLSLARQEGPLMIYHIVPADKMADIAQRYRDKYGLEIVLWKGSNEGITQRVFAETRNERQEFDVLQLSASIQPIFEVGALGDIEAVIGRKMPENLMANHGQWYSSHSVAFVFAYNTNLVKPENVPTSFEDLMKPFWAGNLGFSQGSDAAWIATVYRTLGTERADVFLASMASGGVQVRRNYTLLGSLLAAGEFYGTPHMFVHSAEVLKQQGAPIDYVPIEPVVTIRHVWSIAKHFKRPASTALFFDLLEEEAETSFVDQGYISSAETKFPGRDLALNYVDFEVESLDVARQWRAKYAQFLRNSTI